MVKMSVDYYQHLNAFLFEKKARGLAPQTLDSYEFSINRFLNFLGDKEISKLTFYDFINSLDTGGETKKHYARELRVFFYWLMEEGILQPFKVSLPKSQEPAPRIPTREEVQRLLVKANNTFTEERMWATVNLVLSTGIRLRTIINLKVSDVSFENKQLLLRETKGKKVSVIPLNDTVVLILHKYIKKWNLTDWLFPGRDGGQWKSECLKSAYDRYTRARNVSQHGIHSLRHYFATEATRNGVSPFVLKTILQHADIETTLKYVNLVNEDIRAQMNSYNPLK